MLHRLALPFVLSMVSVAYASPTLPQAPEKYPISHDDNLSSISKTIFGDSNYWPRLWGHKRQILNPGNSIQFLLGNEDSAPSFAISEGDEDFSGQTYQPSLRPAAAKSNSEIEIPPPTVRPKPVLNLGSAFPTWHAVGKRRSSFKDYDVEVLPRKPLIAIDHEFIPVFVQDGPVAAIGEYVQTASDAGLVYENEEVLVRIKRSNGQIGSHYLMLRDGGQLKKGWNSRAGNHTGHVVEVLGEIVLTSQEPGESEGGYDHFRARVIHAISVSARGAAIVPGQVTWMNTSPSGSVSSVQAEIIGGNFDQRGMLFGEGDWVFLNRGAKDGLQEGQLIWTNTLPSNYETGSPFKIGVHNASLIKIAKVASEVSTGIVLSSKQGLMQRDFTNGSQASASSFGGDNGFGAGSGGGEDLGNDLNIMGDETGMDPGSELGGDGVGGL